MGQGEVPRAVLDDGPDGGDVLCHVLILDDAQEAVPQGGGDISRDVLLLLLHDVDEAVPECAGQVGWNILLNIRNLQIRI